MSTDGAPDNFVQAQATPGHLPPQQVCLHCGSANIVRGLKIGQRADISDIGLKYEASASFLGIVALGTEPLRVDLCENCGTVVRMYVAQRQKWSAS